jgi:hypothetical protein
MPYRYQWGLTVMLTILAGMLAVVAVTDPMALGISPVAKNWMIVVQAGITGMLAFLPKITRPPTEGRDGMD